MIRSLGRQHGVRPRTLRALCALCACYGESDVLERAAAELKGPAVRAALANLAETNARLSALGLGRRVLFDLGETRGWEYYTGLRFSVLVDGPGQALGQGGRYDRLLSRFGMDAPATGFALALGHLQWTLRDDPRREQQHDQLRLLLSGAPALAAAELCARLRAAGIAVAVLAGKDADQCLAFARAWGYHGVLLETRRGLRLVRATDGTRHSLAGPDPRRIRKLITL
jgi:ATP phosphoribosyltransferase regulatory subunit